LQFALPGSQLTESTDATDDKILLWDESVDTWKYMTLDDLQDSIDTGGGAHLALGSTSSTAHRGDHGVTAYNHVSSAHLALGGTSSTAHRGDHGAAAYTHSTSTHIDMANGSNNRVVTATDSNSLNGESTMTYDGTQLSINAPAYGAAIATTKFLSFGEGSAGNDVQYVLASAIIYSLTVSVVIVSTSADTVRTTVTVNSASANSTVDLTSLSAHGS
jgi:hypothetical protein